MCHKNRQNNIILLLVWVVLILLAPGVCKDIEAVHSTDSVPTAFYRLFRKHRANMMESSAGCLYFSSLLLTWGQTYVFLISGVQGRVRAAPTAKYLMIAGYSYLVVNHSPCRQWAMFSLGGALLTDFKDSCQRKPSELNPLHLQIQFFRLLVTELFSCFSGTKAKS